jgi:hypothetical protein
MFLFLLGVFIEKLICTSPMEFLRRIFTPRPLWQNQTNAGLGALH